MFNKHCLKDLLKLSLFLVLMYSCAPDALSDQSNYTKLNGYKSKKNNTKTELNNTSRISFKNLNKFKDKINLFIKRNFSISNEKALTPFSLSDREMEQLFWLADGSYSTTEHSVLAVNKSFPVEILRTLTRIYCLHLLREDTELSYKLFIQPQIKHYSNHDILQYKSFKSIASYISKLPQVEYNAMRVATITYSLMKTKSAILNSKKYLSSNQIPEDSIDFLSYTIKKSPQIYPLFFSFISKHPNSKELFSAAFSSDMHLRHMLFVEGGVGMFKNLREKLQYDKINKSKLDFWYYFWLINIAGFYGHMEHDGCLMLDNNTFKSLAELKYHLDQMLYKPNYNPLIPYMYYRASILGLSNQSQEFNLNITLAQIGAMLKFYDKNKGKKLYNSFNKIDEENKIVYINEITKLLTSYEDKTPSYAPAFFINCYHYANNDLDKALKYALPLYANALKQYRELREQGKIADNLRLSFYNISKKENIEWLFSNFPSAKYSLPKIYIDDNACIRFSDI